MKSFFFCTFFRLGSTSYLNDCMVLNAVFQQSFSYVTAASAPIHPFLEFFKPVLCTIFFPGYWLLSHITIAKTTKNGESGINPVPMTTINLRKEYWPSRGSNQRPPLLKSATIPTEQWGSADQQVTESR